MKGRGGKLRFYMKHFIKLTVRTLCVLGVCGCSSLDYVQGAKVSEDMVACFTIAQTTKNEIINALGGPQDIKFEGGKQILLYKYQRISSNPFAPNEDFDTIFIFNDKGVLEEILKSKGSSLPNPLIGN